MGNAIVAKEKKPGIFRKAGSYLYRTLADDGTSRDDRDIVQIIADSVMGPTPGRKVARTSAVAGASLAIGGLFSGSVTLMTVGGITFIVGGTAEAIQYLKGNKENEVEDAPHLEDITDDQAIEEVGVAKAAEAKSNLYVILKDVATSTFQMTEAKFNQLWSQAQAHSLHNQKFSGAKKQRYNDIVNVAAAMGKVQLKAAS